MTKILFARSRYLRERARAEVAKTILWIITTNLEPANKYNARIRDTIISKGRRDLVNDGDAKYKTFLAWPTKGRI